MAHRAVSHRRPAAGRERRPRHAYLVRQGAQRPSAGRRTADQLDRVRYRHVASAARTSNWPTYPRPSGPDSPIPEDGGARRPRAAGARCPIGGASGWVQSGWCYSTGGGLVAGGPDPRAVAFLLAYGHTPGMPCGRRLRKKGCPLAAPTLSITLVWHEPANGTFDPPPGAGRLASCAVWGVGPDCVARPFARPALVRHDIAGAGRPGTPCQGLCSTWSVMWLDTGAGPAEPALSS